MKSKDQILLENAYESIKSHPMVDKMMQDENLKKFLKQSDVNFHVGMKNKAATHDDIVNIVDSFLEKLRDYMIPKVMNPNKRFVDLLPERPGEKPVYRN